MSSKRFRAFVLLIVLFSASLTLAGFDFASLSGTVTDASGAAVSNAVISAHQVAGSALVTAVTDASGHFLLKEIAPGEYLIDASARGLSLQTPKRVKLVSGERQKISLGLVVSAIKTEVSVTAAALPQSVDQISKQLDIVNTADAERRGIISVSDAVRFVPGLRVSTRGGPGAFTTIQTRGLRVTDTAILIDGFPFRDPTSVQNEASAYIGDLLLVDSSRIEILQGSG